MKRKDVISAWVALSLAVREKLETPSPRTHLSKIMHVYGAEISTKSKMNKVFKAAHVQIGDLLDLIDD